MTDTTEHDAMLNVFLAQLQRTAVELHTAIQFDTLTTWTGMLQASAQMITQINRPWAAELLRAYADCIANQPGTKRYQAAERKFISTHKRLHERLRIHREAVMNGGIQ